MKKLTISIMTLVLFTINAIGQNQKDSSEINLISEVLMDYIEGTANGEPNRLKEAFHPDFNLYTIVNDSLRIRSGKQYIAGIKEGKKSNRIGRIVSIDIQNNAAMAKVEIDIPNWKIFTDYFLLLKYQGNWHIVQKSYTFSAYPKKE